MTEMDCHHPASGFGWGGAVRCGSLAPTSQTSLPGRTTHPTWVQAQCSIGVTGSLLERSRPFLNSRTIPRSCTTMSSNVGLQSAKPQPIAFICRRAWVSQRECRQMMAGGGLPSHPSFLCRECTIAASNGAKIGAAHLSAGSAAQHCCMSCASGSGQSSGMDGR